jgi:hypothetical protein
MLGRHRYYFDRVVCGATGVDHVEWLDFPSGEMRQDKEGHILWDREWHHFQFLPDGDRARSAWDGAWPTHRTGHNWDAIGKLRYATKMEWLLVEAKANLEELSSDCGATDADSIKLIRTTLDRTKVALGAPETCDWMRPYYQILQQTRRAPRAKQRRHPCTAAVRLLLWRRQ